MHQPAQTFARYPLALCSPAMVLAALVAFTGCEKREDVRVYSAPKEESAPAGKVAGAGGSTVAGGKDVDWTVPAGWKALPARPMLYAGFSVSSDDPDTSVTVTPLPSSGLAANVNRWEGQLKLPPSSAEHVEKMVRHLDLPAAHADLVDLTGPEPTDGKKRQRMIVALIERGPQTWFFKLMGSADTIAAQEATFQTFLQSVRFADAGGDPHAGHDHAKPAPASPVAPAGPPAAAGASEKLTKYTTPAGWAKDEQPRPMRLMTFKLSGADKADEVTVIKLSSSSTGGMLDNVNRWRGQVGLPPATEVNEKDTPRVTIGGQEAMLFDFASPEGKPSKRQIVALAPRGEDVWFFKAIGEASVVAAQADAFKQFLSSIEFGKE